MEQENLSGWQKRKWYLLTWVATTILGIGLVNLGDKLPFLSVFQCHKKGFGFFSVCLSGDIASAIGFGFGGIIIGFVVAFFIKLFSKKIEVWSIIIIVGIIYNIVASLGAYTGLK